MVAHNVIDILISRFTLLRIESVVKNLVIESILLKYCDNILQPLFLWSTLGMGRYEKYVHQEVANAKPYRFRDSVF